MLAGAWKAGLAALALGTAPLAAVAGPVLLFEPATGIVLHAEDADRSWHPASVTKMMTAYLTFEAVRTGRLAWDGEVVLSEHARSQPATRIGLKAGIRLNVEQAVRGMILRSANDFSTALAETVGGSEEHFIELMNDTAKRLGMTRTRFRNPHGLPDAEQVTTARDLAILTTALLRDFPDRAEVFATPSVHIHKGTFHTQNDLLRNLDGADGLKTGFTCASGYNVVASATRSGRRLVAIVLGAVNRQKRSEQAEELLEAGFVHLAGESRPRDGTTADGKGAVKGTADPLADKAGDTPGLAHALLAVPLQDLPLAPREPVAPYDMTREVRSGKCGGGGPRIARRAATTAAKAEPVAAGATTPPLAASAVATGSIRKASGTRAKSPARQ